MPTVFVGTPISTTLFSWTRYRTSMNVNWSWLANSKNQDAELLVSVTQIRPCMDFVGPTHRLSVSSKRLLVVVNLSLCQLISEAVQTLSIGSNRTLMLRLFRLHPIWQAWEKFMLMVAHTNLKSTSSSLIMWPVNSKRIRARPIRLLPFFLELTHLWDTLLFTF